MQFDFEQDLKQEMHHQFSGYGVKLPIKARFHDQLLDYLTVLKKYILPSWRENVGQTPKAQSSRDHPL
jgi:hypothetical protein